MLVKRIDRCATHLMRDRALTPYGKSVFSLAGGALFDGLKVCENATCMATPRSMHKMQPAVARIAACQNINIKFIIPVTKKPSAMSANTNFECRND
jgi:hypothetical protein